LTPAKKKTTAAGGTADEAEALSKQESGQIGKINEVADFEGCACLKHDFGNATACRVFVETHSLLKFSRTAR
jgi:hypothetical protein